MPAVVSRLPDECIGWHNKAADGHRSHAGSLAPKASMCRQLAAVAAGTLIGRATAANDWSEVLAPCFLSK